MAKKIKWSPEAVADRIRILDYWVERTGNKRYSRKLDKAFREVVTMLSRSPEIGREVENREERYFVKGNYLVFYQIREDSIDILHLWDGRRNPDDLKLSDQ